MLVHVTAGATAIACAQLLKTLRKNVQIKAHLSSGEVNTCAVSVRNDLAIIKLWTYIIIFIQFCLYNSMYEEWC